ncbi:MAG TPA: hypothetical protein VHE33_18795 [Acidobacteriaceae bacterium]|nr:hypothetical protein [Acidobacteriaceae bacterium]
MKAFGDKSRQRVLRTTICAAALYLGSAGAARAQTPSVTYHNGTVINTPSVFVLFWGSFDERTEVPTAMTYLSDLAGYISNPGSTEPTIRQYGVFSASVSTFRAGQGWFHDTATPPGDPPSDAQIFAEVAQLQAFGFIPPYSAQTLILVTARTSGGCSAHHTTAGPNQWVGFVPYGGGLNCTVHRTTSPAKSNNELAWEAQASHEIFEAATNPDLSTGWHADNVSACTDGELADCDQVASVPGCSWNGTNGDPTDFRLTFANGHQGYVAHIFDKSSRGCAYRVPLGQSGQLSLAGGEDLGANLIGSPGVALSSWTGRLDVFATGTDRNVYTKHCTGVCLNNWSNWTTLPAIGIGSGIFSQPAAVSWAPNRIDVVALNSVGSVMHVATTDGTNWEGWDNALGGSYVRVAIDSQGPNSLDVFGMRSDGGVDVNQLKNGSWTGWLPIGGSAGRLDTSRSFSATSWGTGRIDIMGFNNNTLPHDSRTSGWAPWNLVPSPVPPCNGNITLAARGFGQLVAMCSTSAGSGTSSVFQSGVGWTPWRSGGLGVNTSVAASTSWNGARTDVLFTDSQGHLTHGYTFIP